MQALFSSPGKRFRRSSDLWPAYTWPLRTHSTSVDATHCYSGRLPRNFALASARMSGSIMCVRASLCTVNLILASSDSFLSVLSSWLTRMRRLFILQTGACSPVSQTGHAPLPVDLHSNCSARSTNNAAAGPVPSSIIHFDQQNREGGSLAQVSSQSSAVWPADDLFASLGNDLPATLADGSNPATGGWRDGWSANGGFVSGEDAFNVGGDMHEGEMSFLDLDSDFWTRMIPNSEGQGGFPF